jgi:bifunctional enzyme CysN/CysC
MSVSISLEDDIDISRGDMLARPFNQPTSPPTDDATCAGWPTTPLEPGRDYVDQAHHPHPRVITDLKYR